VDSTTIRLIGRMRAEHLEELEKQIREERTGNHIGPGGSDLVDVEIVRFLGACEHEEVTASYCSPYIRDWIGKERD